MSNSSPTAGPCCGSGSTPPPRRSSARRSRRFETDARPSKHPSGIRPLGLSLPPSPPPGSRWGPPPTGAHVSDRCGAPQNPPHYKAGASPVVATRGASTRSCWSPSVVVERIEAVSDRLQRVIHSVHVGLEVHSDGRLVGRSKGGDRGGPCHEGRGPSDGGPPLPRQAGTQGARLAVGTADDVRAVGRFALRHGGRFDGPGVFLHEFAPSLSICSRQSSDQPSVLVC